MALGRLAAVLQFSFRKTAGAPYGSVHSAAGCFTAREAGAIVTDLDDGSQWKLATRSFSMASTVELHKDLSRTVSGIGEVPPRARRVGVEIDTDIAEDFNLGGRGHRSLVKESGGRTRGW